MVLTLATKLILIFGCTNSGYHSIIGINASQTESNLIVTAVRSGYPADQAGIKAGMRIITVNTRPATADILATAIQNCSADEVLNIVIEANAQYQLLHVKPRRFRIICEHKLSIWEQRERIKALEKAYRDRKLKNAS